MTGINRLIHEPARLAIMTHLYVVQSADYLFLQKQTGLTWGNLASHLARLEEAGYVQIEKGFSGKKPRTMLRLTTEGRDAFDDYRNQLTQVLSRLPGAEGG